MTSPIYLQNVPKWYENLAQQLGQGFGQQYLQNTEQNQLQQALGALGQNASPQQMQEAIGMTNVRPETQQRFLQNVVAPRQQQQQMQKQMQGISSLEKQLGFQPGALAGVNDAQIKGLLGYMGQQQAQAQKNQQFPLEFSQFLGSEDFAKLTPGQSVDKINEMFPNRPDLVEFGRKQSEANRKSGIEDEQNLREGHKLTQDYYADLREKGAKAKEKMRAIGEVNQALKNTKTGTFSWDSALKKVGLQGLMSKDSTIVEAEAKKFYEGLRPIFGGVITDNQQRVLESMVISLAKSTEGNKALLDLYSTEAELDEGKFKIAQELSKKYSKKGYRPSNFDELVEEEFNTRYRDKLLGKYEDFIRDGEKTLGKTADQIVSQDAVQVDGNQSKAQKAEPPVAPGSVRLYYQGKFYDVPEDKAEASLKIKGVSRGT